MSSDRETGFTLLELLIALSLLGLLSLVLWSGLSFGTQAWRRSGDAMSDDNRIRVIQAELTHEIASALPAFEQIDAAHARIAFDGTAQRLQFLTPDSALPGAMASTTIEEERDGDQIVLRSVAHPELAPSSRGVARVLFRGLKSLEFAYFGSDTPQDPPFWHSAWQDRTRPPQLIRIRIAFADPKRHPWPDLVVAPRIEADASCILDPVTKYCVGR